MIFNMNKMKVKNSNQKIKNTSTNVGLLFDEHYKQFTTDYSRAGSTVDISKTVSGRILHDLYREIHTQLIRPYKMPVSEKVNNKKVTFD